VGRSPASALTLPAPRLRHDLVTVLRSAIDAVNAGLLVRRTLDAGGTREAMQRAAAVDVIAAGKAAAAMIEACAVASVVPLRTLLAIGPRLSPGSAVTLPASTIWYDAGHPLPDAGSVAGAERALEVARGSGERDLLLVLISGGGSALMAVPARGIPLDAKQRTARLLMEQGADIYELNTVRKHLSAIKGGQLALAARGSVLTLAVSDVIGDDLSVIASGPTVADDSTFAGALDVLARRGGEAIYPQPVVDRLRSGAAGQFPETPSSGDARLARAVANVIGPQRGAIDGARRAAEALGYHVYVVPEPVAGEARDAGRHHVTRTARAVASMPRPACVIASGETTVTVRGTGKGGRNQEFALAMAQSLAALGSNVVGASIGTDGIDGPTDAAGAIVDPTTFARAAAAGLAAPEDYLNDNNTYAFFDRIGDLIRTGPTNTNVGDLQVILVA
jgi:hydroxypyruvate reductase